VLARGTPPAGRTSAAFKALEAKIDKLVAGLDHDDDHPTMLKKKWYTVRETALSLGLKPGTIRQACNLGRIPDARKTSNGWRIPRAAIERIENEGLPPISK